jgi:ABC-type branched-subunit amino acid transport system ATPase component/ABC-type branched-subunit amino acid transport system permease subunit
MTHVSSLLLGLGNGGVFAALAVALVLTYRSSGVVNFATGTMALYTAYTYAWLREGKLLVLLPGAPKAINLGGPLGFVPAALLSLLIAAVIGALLYLTVFRPLRQAPQLARAVASLGVLVVVQGLIVNRVGDAPVSVTPIFPAQRWQWGSVILLSDRCYLALTVLGLTLALAALYRWTRFGLLTRAVAETQTGAIVSGVSPERVALVNWMASAVVAGAAGILIAPISPLTPDAYTLAVVPALAAAVVGGFDLLIPAALAGIIIGMFQSEGATLAAQHHWLPQTGSAELIPLLVIVGALLLTGRAMPIRGGIVRQQLGRAPRPRSFLLPAIAGTAAGVLALLLTQGTWRSGVIGTLIAAIIALSYVVVTGYAGQVSLAQLTLAGVGAFALSGMTQSWGVPFPLAPLLAALVATGVGIIVGLPALRLRGLTLGIVTLALAYAIEALWFRNGQFVKPRGASVVQPKLFGLNLGIGTGRAFPRIEFGLLCLFALVAVAWGVARLRTSPLGSAMLAVRANERSAAGIGVNVVRVKLASFGLASFIAGIAGALFAYRQGVVTFASFTAIGGLALLATVYLAGITSVSGGILGGVIATSGVVFLAVDRWAHLGDWFAVITGIGVIAVLIRYPEGIAAAAHKQASHLRRFKRLGSRRQSPTPMPLTSQPPIAATTPAGANVATLAISHLTVHYGGVVAVSDVSMRFDAGRVVGLIGPNGAGKTSLIDAVTGFAPAEGSVVLNGEHLEGLPPHARIRRGLARTFQALELYDDLTVEENVSAAVFSTAHEDRHRQVTTALERAGLGPLRDRYAGELSQGERQMVSIARACVSKPRVLLLDEPAAGLDTTDSRRLGERIRDITAAGVAGLLVDHDVALVLTSCDYIYVLDFGVVIAEGDAATIRSDRALAEAYLGTRHETSRAAR